MDLISHPAFARLHGSAPGASVECTDRLRCLLDRFPEYVQGRPAERSRIARVHEASYLDAIESVASLIWLDADTFADATTSEAAEIGRAHV